MNNLKKYRAEVFDRVKEDNQKKNLALKKLDIIFNFGNSKNTTITFDELKLFRIGERISINEDVIFEKIYDSDDKMVFLTHLLEGGSFGVHNHDCTEVCEILKGNLFEKTRGLKVYSEGDIVIYAQNEKHIPYATEDSTYKVTFIKNIL